MCGSLSKEAVNEVAAACPADRKPDVVFMLNKALYYFRWDGTVISTFDKDHLYHFISVLRYRLDLQHCHCADLSAYLPVSMSHQVAGTANASDVAQVTVTE
jgi:hypothetical protein